MYASLLQDVLPAAVVAAQELVSGSTQPAQDGEFMRLDTLSNHAYVQSCGQVCSDMIHAAPLDVFPLPPVAASLVCAPRYIQHAQRLIYPSLQRINVHWHGTSFHCVNGCVQVHTCALALRLSPRENTHGHSPEALGFDCLLQQSMQRVAWTFSASLLSSVAEKLRICIQCVAIHGMYHHQGLSMQNKFHQSQDPGIVGGALEVLSHAWDVLTADDGIVAAAAQQTATLPDTINHWKHMETPSSPALRHLHNASVLIHTFTASMGLQVCLMLTLHL